MQIIPGIDTVIVAHRGASVSAPENTIPSFQLAFKEKADFIEGDFWLTKDNEIVCIHDADTKRVTGNKVKLPVRSSTLAELKKLDVGSWKGAEYKGASIPTLQEVLEIIPEGKGIYLEIKDYREKFLKRLIEILNTSPISKDRIRIITFNPWRLRSPKKYLTGIKLYRLYGCFFSQYSYSRFLTKQWLIFTRKVADCDGIDAIAASFIDEKLVKSIRDSNLKFCTWGIDTIEDAVRLINLGVDSITTNSPLRMREEITNYFSPANS
jgi:glycerophosphoryl diester phosphodiesterase